MVIKKPGHKKPSLRRGLNPRWRLTYTGRISSSAYPPPPAELAGKWVAWSEDHQVVAAGDTLSEVAKAVDSMGVKDVSYGHVPRRRRSEVR